jgi:hypothetical protein
MNTSKSRTDRPHAVQPVPESIVGAADINAYRGLDVHGVPHNGVNFHDVPPVDDSTLVVFDAPEDEPEPIPVKIVSTSRREIKTFHVRREYAMALQAIRIANRNMERTKLRITNIGTVVLYISDNESVTTNNGYPLAVNAEYVTDTQDDVWAVSADGTQQPVAILMEYTAPLDSHGIHPLT